jgi:peptidoglycan/xylan/chitin deacetylase (PgdA/CDA1 family)
MLINRVVSIGFLLLLTLTGAGAFLWSRSLWVPLSILFLFLLTKIYGSIFIDSNFYIKTLCKGNRSGNSIAITFDDGPMSGSTDRVLKILKEKNVKATFFCIGKNVEGSEALLKQIDSEGHLIGNHSFEHRKFFDLQHSKAMQDELMKTDQAILKVIHKKPNLFRPPYGVTNPSLAKAVRKGSYQTVGWSVRSYDTISKNRNQLWNRVTKKLKAGDVVLFHDRCEITIDILPDFIDHVLKIGLKIAPLDQVLNIKPYA